MAPAPTGPPRGPAATIRNPTTDWTTDPTTATPERAATFGWPASVGRPVPDDPLPTDRPTVGAPAHPDRRRLPVAAAMVAAATVVAAVVVPGGPGVRAKPLAPPDLRSYIVVTTGTTGVTVTPLDGQPAFQPVSTPVEGALPTTDGVAFVNAGEAEVLPAPFSGPPEPLAPADRIFPMPGLGTLGVDTALPSGGAAVSYVDVDTGTSLSAPAWELPPGYRAVGQYLAEGPGGRLRVWAPVPGPAAQLSPTFGHALSVAGVDDSTVAWFPAGACTPGRECPLELTYIGLSPEPGPTTEAVPLAGHRGFLPGGAISPDGRHVAVFVSERHGTQAELAIVDLTTLQSRVVPGSAVPVGPGGAAVQWAPDGSAVFFASAGGPMHGYRLDDRRAAILALAGSLSFEVF